MKRMIYSAAIFLCSLLIWSTPATAKTFEAQVITNPEKVWDIQFNAEILFNEQTKNFIYIKNNAGDRHPASLTISDDLKHVSITPKVPFTIGESYSLIITKEVQSLKGKQIKEETSMSFMLQGEYIRSVQAALNPWLTNVVIQGTKDIASMTISVNENTEISLHKGSNFQFTRGMLGLVNGDELHIRAYSEQGSLLEEMTYQISE